MFVSSPLGGCATTGGCPKDSCKPTTCRQAAERLAEGAARGKDTHAGQTERRDQDRGLAIRFRLEGEASGGSVAVFEFDVPAGDRVPGAHSHDAYEGTIYGLGGALSWTLYVRQTDVGPGEVVCIPRGVVHRFDNDREVDAKMLAIITPGILGPAYFREMAAVLKAATDGPPDPAALGEVMRRYGLTPAP
jgi:quercetin dioxygenase-like cupin family protein